jgi:NADPH:quinone reductase-like Zn-dependent oxidoreductase
MRVWEMQQFDLSGLVLTERPDPTAGPGAAIVDVAAVSLNYRDWMLLQGTYNPRQRLPMIPCSDGAGVVSAVGPGVTRVKPGDRVMGLLAQNWLAGPPTLERRRATLGSPLDGMLAERVVLSAEGLVHTPEHLSDIEASTLPCAALTAWNALFEHGNLAPGDTLLVQGTGGVSVFALQLARCAGARVIVISSSAAKLERALTIGAWQGINYIDTPDWELRARELTGLGVDHIVEVGGANTFVKSLKAVRVGGTISVIGVLGGSTTDVPLSPVLMHSLRVQGIFVGSREMFERMNRAIAGHELRPVIDRVFAFEQAPAAMEYLARGRHFGKICVQVRDSA